MARQTSNEEEEFYETDEEYDTGEEGESEEEEDDEPQFNYERLFGNLTSITSRDSASALAVHDKLLALGTHLGYVYILDFKGNQIREFGSHSGTVNEISIDDKGNYLASCGDDGRVVIVSLCSNERFDFNFEKPVKTVAIDPHFSKKGNKPFVSGGLDYKFSLTKKGWFKHASQVIHGGEGPVYACKWNRHNNNLVAWANEVCIQIIDIELLQRITRIPRDREAPRGDLFRCCLCWERDDLLIIGWGKTVTIAQTKVTPQHEREANPNIPSKYTEIVSHFAHDYFICGLTPYDQNLCLLTLEEPAQGDSPTPEIQIVNRTGDAVTSEDSIEVNGYQALHANAYRLEYCGYDKIFYIVSPRDIISARPRDNDDHITWLLAKNRFEEALLCAERNEKSLQKYTLKEVAEKFIHSLIASGNFARAASEGARLLKRDSKAWELLILLFFKSSKEEEIIPYITPSDPQLSETIYELVLNYYLNSPPERNQQQQHEKLLETLRKWPKNIYNVKNITTAISDKLREAEFAGSPHLLNAIAELFNFEQRYGETLGIYLKLKRADVFDFIAEHCLFEHVENKVQNLMEFDSKHALDLLVNNTDKIKIDKVVAQLKSNRQFLHMYLNALFKKDVHAGRDFHPMQVELYAEFAPQDLLVFLKQSQYIPLEKAYAICEAKQLYREMVFILGRMGNNKEALELTINKLADIPEAIEFIQSQNDDELWKILKLNSLKKPQLISDFLEHIGSRLDPPELIQFLSDIPPHMEISGLKDKLTKIISDYTLQATLQQGCNAVLQADIVMLCQRLYRLQRKGVRVQHNKVCNICLQPLPQPQSSHLDHHPITTTEGEEKSDLEAQGQKEGEQEALTQKKGSDYCDPIKSSQPGIIVFLCTHSYHSACYKNALISTKAPTLQDGDNNNNRKYTCIICHRKAKDKSDNVRKKSTLR